MESKTAVEYSSNYTEEEKGKLIKREILKLKRIFKNLQKDKLDTAMGLIGNAAFMYVTLQDLQKTITREGTISEYQNGANQWGTKKSPSVDIYNVMIKNYASVIKQLTELLPDPKPIDDGFDDFISSR